MIRFCLEIYRRLARAFPHEFQIVYGAEVVQLGEDAIEEIAGRHGAFGLLRLVADLAWRVPMEYLSEMRKDLIYALRMLLKTPGVTMAAVLSLGLGIGVPTAGFSFINVLFLRDLPGARDPDRLLTTESPTSYVHFERYRDHRDLFSGVTAYVEHVPFSVTLGGRPERIFGQLVSPEYFDVIGVRAMRGQTDGVVVSELFWREQLNSDPDVVGRTLRVNGRALTISGVGPRDFQGARPEVGADLFVPMTMQAELVPDLAENTLRRSDLKAFDVLMRMQPGVTAKSAGAAVETIARQLDDEGFDADRSQKGLHVRLLPGGAASPSTPEEKAAIIGLLGTLMALILGISCTNLANMLLARAAGRRKETAIRLAVGASRFRLIRQLLTESMLLALCGGAAGFAFAYWLMGAATTMLQNVVKPLSLEVDLRPDGHVLLFTFALAAIAGLGFGLAPALAATKTDLGLTLKQGGVAQLRGYRRFGLRNLLMVSQVAGSLMVLVITGFIVLGVPAKQAHVTFNTANLYLMSIDPVRDGYSPDQTAALFEKLRERLRSAPAIESAAFADRAPGSVLASMTSFHVPASGGEPGKVVKSVSKEIVGANYFATLRVKVAAGREFSARDEQGVAIVSETAAAEMFGEGDPIGRRIINEKESFEVVGVVPDLKARGFGGKPSSEVWVPLTKRAYSRPPEGGVTLMVRASGSGTDAIAEIRHEMAAIDPNLTMFHVRTMNEDLDVWNNLIQSAGVVYGGFGVFGLILASVGLAGVTAYSVAQRRKEIGIRMALGARPGQVLRLVMKEGATMVIAGSALGFLGAWGISQMLAAWSPDMAESLLRAKRPLLLIGAPALLAGLAMLACYFPARRSTAVDPLTSLRQE
jgi:predicted permease